MENVNIIEELHNNLFSYLTGHRRIANENIIFRKHTNKLDSSGELSFPLNVKAWKRYINNDEKTDLPILNYINRQNEDTEICNKLLDISKNWDISISKCVFKCEKLNVFINRFAAFKNIIPQILLQKNNYGSCNLPYNSKLYIQIENEDETLSGDLTELRLLLLQDVINNLLKATGNFNIITNSETILLSTKSQIKSNVKKIVCGVVISNKNCKKNTHITAKEYYNKRTVDMQLMAQHKYGVRVNCESGWKEFFEKLGKAAVAIDLLHVKTSRCAVINIEDATCSHGRGASFILYNCARLSTVLKKFDEKVKSGIYPLLPAVEDIDFSLLNQSEEWEIVYVYLMQYPLVVQGCIKNIENCMINVHKLCNFLVSLCTVFSLYYQRVRFLSNPRIHLFPVLQARIYLLKAVQEVLHSALMLLNIPPVKQM